MEVVLVTISPPLIYGRGENLSGYENAPLWLAWWGTRLEIKQFEQEFAELTEISYTTSPLFRLITTGELLFHGIH